MFHSALRHLDGESAYHIVATRKKLLLSGILLVFRSVNVAIEPNFQQLLLFLFGILLLEATVNLMTESVDLGIGFKWLARQNAESAPAD